MTDKLSPHQPLPDRELCVLCAQAMGYRVVDDFADCEPPVAGIEISRDFMAVKNAYTQRYDPLSDDRQAMELLRQKRLNIIAAGHPAVHWIVTPRMHPYQTQASGASINRAIVECVAMMEQREKVSAT